MLGEALAMLASTGGTALVTAMVTDSWEGVRARFARVIGRGRQVEIEAAEVRLEQSRAALKGLTGSALERAQAEQVIVWRTRLSDLLEQDPGVGDKLQALITEVQVQMGDRVGRIEQHVKASDHAKVAVLGQGTQNVTFGERHEPGASRG